MTHLAVAGLLWVLWGPQQPPPPQDACEGSISIAVDEGRLSARFEHCTLGRVIEELARRTKINLVAEQQATGDEISAHVQRQPVEAGLRRILAGYDLFFFYSATNPEGSLPKSVWIYPRGSASTIRPVPMERWASAKELEAGLAESEPEVREKAYRALMERPDRHSRELVLGCILGETERDEGLRQRLLSAAISNGFKIPPHLLAQLARADASVGIRWMALDSLAESPQAKSVAEAALADPDESIRQRAQEILAAHTSAPKP